MLVDSSARGSYEVENENENADPDYRKGQNLRELTELLLKGSSLVLRLRKSFGYLTHFGVHSRVGNYGYASSVNDRTAHIYHILPVAERNVLLTFEFQPFDLLQRRNAFARESRFLDLHTRAFDYSRVGRHRVARFEYDYIAYHEVLAFDYLFFAVTDDLARRGCHFLKSFYGFLGFVFLNNSENRVQKHDEYDYDNVRKGFVLDYRHNARNHGSRNKNKYHRIGKLL